MQSLKNEINELHEKLSQAGEQVLSVLWIYNVYLISNLFFN